MFSTWGFGNTTKFLVIDSDLLDFLRSFFFLRSTGMGRIITDVSLCLTAFKLRLLTNNKYQKTKTREKEERLLLQATAFSLSVVHPVLIGPRENISYVLLRLSLGNNGNRTTAAVHFDIVSSIRIFWKHS